MNSARSAYTDAAAQSAHCWFNVDRVPRDPATTAWKRRARWGQGQWREARGYPIGSEPYRGGSHATSVGSRLDLAFARGSGANFITPGVLTAVRARLAAPERFQMLKEDRLFADLLSSMPLCFNLFGDLACDGAAARRAVRSWWPDAPSGDVRVRFEHSPGRRDPVFLGNQSAFDVAFDIDAGAGSRAIVGVETKYHEHAVAEDPPKPVPLARYFEVTERSQVFADGWRERVVGTDLQQIWLDHLLVLAMLQHPSKQWAWGRFVLVYPAANPSFASAVARYSGALVDTSTFAAVTIEQLVVAPGAIDVRTADALAERYPQLARPE
jgi:hypothetical protein